MQCLRVLNSAFCAVPQGTKQCILCGASATKQCIERWALLHTVTTTHTHSYVDVIMIEIDCLYVWFFFFYRNAPWDATTSCPSSLRHDASSDASTWRHASIHASQSR